MLDRLQTNTICQIAQYLRTYTYKQPALQQLSQVNRRLHKLVISQVYEYFTITDVIITGDIDAFRYIQPYLSRLLVTDDEGIDDEQWAKGLERLGQMGWEHIEMVSVEFMGIQDGRVQLVVDWILKNLVRVKELWVELDRRDVVKRLFGRHSGGFFANIEKIRIIGKECCMGEEKDSELQVMQIPRLRNLEVVYLDYMATAMTDMVDVVKSQCGTLRDMNIDEYDQVMAERLGLRSDTGVVVVFTKLERLALACIPYQWDVVTVDARNMPYLRSLYFSQCLYPVYAGRNLVRESMSVILMQNEWMNLEILAVDTFSKGDVLGMRGKLPRLRVLSIGTMGNEIDLADPSVPDMPLEIGDLAVILDACPQLVDFRVEVPAVFEDMYNGNAPDNMQSAERPFFPQFQNLVAQEHLCLKHLTINAWAITFDQALLLVYRLPRLCSLEWVLKFSSRHPVSSDVVQLVSGNGAHGSLAHVSMAHVTGVRFKHVFKANLLKFVAALGGGSGRGRRMKTLDVYGALEIPGLAGAIARVAPGCMASFYPLVPSWLAGEDTEEDERDEEDEKDDDDADDDDVVGGNRCNSCEKHV
ncbi:hypothetical protein LPJ64_004577 [Coemansia asiatica]|uniref:Uncharacterized protein n=1 Tax=Coemansia asiatica TaxID=1052880 RepID=A0A9W7XJE3_9FUNG|nr:hypothetical protein LPJ64_004577 [Coemansia asiatica]